MIFGMNKSLFKQLCINYNKEADKELYNLWENNLRCYEEEEIQKAINIIISQDKYFPTFSRMLEAVKSVVEKQSLNIDENYKREKMTSLKVIPEWFDKNIVAEPIEPDDEFKNFIKEFRDAK